MGLVVEMERKYLLILACWGGKDGGGCDDSDGCGRRGGDGDG